MLLHDINYVVDLNPNDADGVEQKEDGDEKPTVDGIELETPNDVEDE